MYLKEISVYYLHHHALLNVSFLLFYCYYLQIKSICLIILLYYRPDFIYFIYIHVCMVLRGCVILISTFSAVFQVGIWPPDRSRVCFLNCSGFLGQFVFAENSPGAKSHWSYLQKQPHRRRESVPCPTAPPSRSETDWTPHQIYTEGERDASDEEMKVWATWMNNTRLYGNSITCLDFIVI